MGATAAGVKFLLRWPMSSALEDLMFDALRDFIQRLGVAEEAGHYRPSDARLALAALLVRAVAIDGETSDEERAKLRDLLARKFDLSGDELDILIEDAVAAEAEAVDLYRFTSVLKNSMSEEERIRVVEDLWEMVYADGKSHEFEENLVWRVAELLAVNRRDRIAAKRQVVEKNSAREDDGA
jgi:uncharacterized tellurite resistance protein B-like protein